MMKRAIWTFAFILLATFARAGTFRDNFNNGNLDHWKVWKGSDQSGQWFVKDGELVGISKSKKGFDSNVSRSEKWKNYEFEISYKLQQTFLNDDNASAIGFLVRASGEGRVALDLFSNGVNWNGVACRKVVKGNTVIVHRGEKVTEEGRWYKARLVAEGNRFQMFIDDEPICDFQSDFPTLGGIVILSFSAQVHFDNVVITGNEVPNGGLSVNPKAQLATTWAEVKAKN